VLVVETKVERNRRKEREEEQINRKINQKENKNFEKTLNEKHRPTKIFNESKAKKSKIDTVCTTK
jgi:hypothetical protein